MSPERERVRVRRVGFRNGSDDELAAMHLVESEIEAERWPGRAPQPLASYLAYARSLPSQFDDHTWIADTDDGTPVGCSAFWSDAAGHRDVVESYVYVRTAWRAHGIGTRLANAMLDEAERERRSSCVWSTFDTVSAGESFSRRAGGRIVRVNRHSEVRLNDLDWEMVQSWIDAGRERAAGYRLEFWAGLYPPELAADAATFHHIMQTAPRDDLEVADVVLDASHAAEIDRHLVESGRERWTIFVRDPSGRCVGGTELTFEPWTPEIALQQNTAIDPAHRGLGLAKWAKAAMLARVRDERPVVQRIVTGNAFSNEPMLAINNALGFRVVEVRTEWQAMIRQLRLSLHPSYAAIVAAHDAAVRAGEDTYLDPDTGFAVMTAAFLRSRGECCGSGCRHCPYG